MRDVPEYDLHVRGMRVDDATSELERLISRARNGGARVFAEECEPSFLDKVFSIFSSSGEVAADAEAMKDKSIASLNQQDKDENGSERRP